MRPPAERPLRLFVAVPAPPEAQAAAHKINESVRGAGDVRWVAPPLLHLTLKFLGSTPPEKLAGIGRALAKTANEFSPFVVELGGAGAFPNPRRPQTIWLAVGGEVQALRDLAGAVDAALHPLGFERETRGYTAHLTIGRVKSPRGMKELSRKLLDASEHGATPVTWRIGELHLMQSRLRPGGPEYITLERFRLGRETEGTG